jgi:hypothetical protein
MQSKNTPVNDFQVAAARASKGFPKNQFFFRQRRLARIHPFLSPQLRQSVVGLRCDQSTFMIVIGASWPNDPSSLGAGRSSSCGAPG